MHVVIMHRDVIHIITNIQDQTSNHPLENSQAAGRWRSSRAANTFAALLIIEMLMKCIFNQINGAFHNYLSLYIGDNDNNTTFVGWFCLFVALLVTFAPSPRSGTNDITRATNKQYALQKSCYCLIYILNKS